VEKSSANSVSLEPGEKSNSTTSQVGDRTSAVDTATLLKLLSGIASCATTLGQSPSHKEMASAKSTREKPCTQYCHCSAFIP